MRTFGELSFKDISDLFGKTESWARVTYHRAKMKINVAIFIIEKRLVQSFSQHRRCCSKGNEDAAPTSNLRRLTRRENRGK